MQRVTRWVDPTYLRNRLVCISLSQSSFIGEEFQTDPSGLPPVFPRDQCERWDVDALRGAAAQHPHQRGLWIFPGALSPDACADITSAVERLTGGHRVQGEQGVPVRAAAEKPPPAAPPAEEAAWEWLSYGHARWMVPLQPAGGVCDAFARGPLSELHSHGCTDARSWPSLGSLGCGGGEALRALEGLPASAMADGFRGRPPLFLQLQRLQRGASIGAHVDQHQQGGRAIMTAVVSGGGSDVRVGGVSFRVATGDVYALEGAARDSVDHEVYHGDEDRLSVTIRYGGRGDEDPYPYPK